MKLSTLIEKLSKLQNEHGDVEVTVECRDSYDETSCQNPDIDVIRHSDRTVHSIQISGDGENAKIPPQR